MTFAGHLLARLCACVVLLHALSGALATYLPIGIGVGPELTPDLNRTLAPHTLDQDLSKDCFVTPLIVDTEGYAKRWMQSQGPFFHHVGASLVGTQIKPWLEPLNMTERVMLEDDAAQCECCDYSFLYSPKYPLTRLPLRHFNAAFTTLNSTDAFEITYLQLDGIKFRYYNYDANTKCYEVLISRPKEAKYRMSIGKEEGERDLDTLHHRETGKRLCYDSLVIHVRPR